MGGGVVGQRLMQESVLHGEGETRGLAGRIEVE